MNAEKISGGTMKFRRIGGSKQLVADKAADIEKVLKLDAALWAMTNIRCDSLVCDKEFLTLVDSDSNGRIRTDEVKAAVAWMLGCLKDLSGVDAASNTLSLDSLNRANPEGEAIYNAVKDALINLGLPDAGQITFEQISDHEKIMANALRNGDGVIPPGPLGDTPEAECVRRIMASGRVHKDVNGSDGINADDLASFETLCRGFLAWNGELTENSAQIMPLGEKTPGAYAAFKAVETAFDDFFRAVEAVRYASAAGTNLQITVNTFDPRDPSSVKNFLERSLVSDVSGGCSAISPAGTLNPVYSDAVKKFFKVMAEAEGSPRNSIDAEAWRKIKTLFAPYRTHLAKKNTDIFDSAPRDVLENYTTENIFAKLAVCIADDKAVAASLISCSEARKLIIYQKNILRFINNFVTMRDLFDCRATSMMQVGKLVMDGRHFTLCTLAGDIAEHKKIAVKSDICVMYVDISTGKGTTLRAMKIAVAVTSGHMRNLFVGKCGIFITPDGTVWDAKVFDFIQQPVSIAEAMREPFYKFGDFLQKQADKFFTGKSKSYEDAMAKNIQNIGTSTVPVPPPGQTPAISGSMMLMGGGIGIAALGSAFAFIAKTMKDISLTSVLAVILGILLIFGGPIILVSLIKLFGRNVALFLEANGLAMNYKMRLSLKLGRLFTFTPGISGSPTALELFNACPDDSKENSTAWKVRAILMMILFAAITAFIIYYILLKA